MAKQRIPNGKYTKEFREEAVKRIFSPEKCNGDSHDEESGQPVFI